MLEYTKGETETQLKNKKGISVWELASSSLVHAGCHVWLLVTPWTVTGSCLHGVFQARILEHCHLLLQGIFPTQGLKLHLLHLLHWQVGSLSVEPPGKPWAQDSMNSNSWNLGHNLKPFSLLAVLLPSVCGFIEMISSTSWSWASRYSCSRGLCWRCWVACGLHNRWNTV